MGGLREIVLNSRIAGLGAWFLIAEPIFFNTGCGEWDPVSNNGVASGPISLEFSLPNDSLSSYIAKQFLSQDTDNNGCQIIYDIRLAGGFSEEGPSAYIYFESYVYADDGKRKLLKRFGKSMKEGETASFYRYGFVEPDSDIEGRVYSIRVYDINPTAFPKYVSIGGKIEKRLPPFSAKFEIN